MAELVDAHGSGPCAARCGGSSPLLGTNSSAESRVTSKGYAAFVFSGPSRWATFRAFARSRAGGTVRPCRGAGYPVRRPDRLVRRAGRTPNTGRRVRGRPQREMAPGNAAISSPVLRFETIQPYARIADNRLRDERELEGRSIVGMDDARHLAAPGPPLQPGGPCQGQAAVPPHLAEARRGRSGHAGDVAVVLSRLVGTALDTVIHRFPTPTGVARCQSPQRGITPRSSVRTEAGVPP